MVKSTVSPMPDMSLLIISMIKVYTNMNYENLIEQYLRIDLFKIRI